MLGFIKAMILDDTPERSKENSGEIFPGITGEVFVSSAGKIPNRYRGLFLFELSKDFFWKKS